MTEKLIKFNGSYWSSKICTQTFITVCAVTLP